MADFPLPSNVAVLKRVGGADPAANAEISDTVPVGKTWLLMAASVSLVQGATQTPNPTLIIDDGSNIVFQSTPLAAAINASVTAQITWAPGVPLSGGGAATVCTVPLPERLYLPAGFRVRTSTSGIGANTNYGPASYLVAELG